MKSHYRNVPNCPELKVPFTYRSCRLERDEHVMFFFKVVFDFHRYAVVELNFATWTLSFFERARDRQCALRLPIRARIKIR